MLICGFVGWLTWEFYTSWDTKRQGQQEMELRVWQRAVDRWDHLYYCARDGIVYLPNDDSYVPAAAVETLLRRPLGWRLMQRQS